MRNLFHDTAWRRVREAVVRSVHGVDDAVMRARGDRVRILFEAASPLSLAIFRPVLERLHRDRLIDVWFTTSDRIWQPERIFASIPGDRLVSPARARWMKFDGYINTDFWNMTWLPRRTRRVHMFHGVAGKYSLDAPVRIAPVVGTFDRLFFPNRDRLMRYAEAGLVDSDSPRAALIGYPKVDCLVDGSLDRRAILCGLGLEPDVPTVLYAPTWSPYSSLNSIGDEVVLELSRLDLNVIVKLHDRSHGGSDRGAGGIDWPRHLANLCADRRVHIAAGADACPYLFAADVLVTDHSSVGFEFMLLDRPIVVINCPRLVDRAGINPEKVTLLRNASEVVSDAASVPRAVLRGLDNPTTLSARRRAAARALFYCPGSATDRAVASVYDLLGLREPARSAAGAPADQPDPGRVGPKRAQRRRDLRTPGIFAAAAQREYPKNEMF